MKNKKISVLTSLVLVILMLLTSITPAFAGATITKVESTKAKYNNGWSLSMYFWDYNNYQYQYPVYCIEPYKRSNLNIGGSRDYDNIENNSVYNNLSATAKAGINLATFYGFPNCIDAKTASHTRIVDYYVATQVIIWEYVTGARTNNSNKNPSDTWAPTLNAYTGAVTAYKEILTAMYNHSTKASFWSNSTITVPYNTEKKCYYISQIDNNAILKNYSVSSNSSDIKAGLQTDNNGNRLVVWSYKAGATGTVTFTENKPKTSTERWTPRFIADAGSDNQTMYYGTNIAPNSFTIKYSTPKNGTLTVFKHNVANGATVSNDVNDAGRVPAANVKITLTGGPENKTQDVTTDSNGKYTFTNLLPGTYTVKETVPEGYDQYGIQYFTRSWAEGPDAIIPTPNGVVNSITINVDSGKNPYVYFINKETPKVPGDLLITKEDGVTHERLEGATFGVYSDATCTNEVYRGTTNADGELSITDIPVGTYYTKEIEAPSGYLISPDIHPVVIESDQVRMDGWRDVAQGVINIVKRDTDTHAYLAGAEFGIFKDADCTQQVATVVTSSDGMVSSPTLDMGTYWVKELKAPAGYKLNTEVKKVELLTDEYVNVYVDPNSITTSLDDANTYLTTPHRVTGPSNDILSHCPNELGVYTLANGENNSSIIYDSNESAYFANINGKTYRYIVTTMAAQNAGVDAFRWYLIDEYNNASLAAFTTDPTIGLNIHTTTPLVDSVYVNLVTSFTDDYTTREYEYGSINVKVVNEGNHAIPAVKVGLFVGESEDPIAIVNTDNNGEAAFYHVPKNVSFTIKDLDGAQNVNLKLRGYQPTDTFYLVKLTSTDSMDVTFTLPNTENNTYVTTIKELTFENDAYRVTLHKSDFTTAEVVPGARIQIYDASGRLYAENTTNNNGDINLYAIPAGTYTFKEVVAPVGYALNTTVFKFTVNADGSITGTTNITDKKTEFTITKTDSKTNEPVKGAEYAFYDENGSLVEYGTTDENGQITFVGWAVGTYTYKETSAPDGYALDPDTHTFFIALNGDVGGVVDVQDTPTLVTIIKTDEEGVPLEGATFVIYTEGGEFYAEVTTDETGTVQLEYIKADSYVYTETSAPVGYALDATEHRFSIDAYGNARGQFIVVDKINIVTIQKTDKDTESPLADAVIEIYDVDGVVVNPNNTITDENGEITIMGLPAGTYTFKEIVAPTGYALNLETFEFTINADGTIDGTTQIANEKTRVVISKVDFVSEEALQGATIEIYDEEGMLVNRDNVITDENGNIILVGLPVGVYTMKETKAPSGYILDTDEYQFVINADGTIDGATTIRNRQTEVIITKVDAADKAPIAGATIEVYDADGNVVNIDNQITDENGNLTLIGLPAGTYTFKEVKAPEGYELNDEVYTFTINEDGTISGITTIEDNAIIPEVKAGGEILMMTALAALSLVAIVLLKKKDN